MVRNVVATLAMVEFGVKVVIAVVEFVAKVVVA